MDAFDFGGIVATFPVATGLLTTHDNSGAFTEEGVSPQNPPAAHEAWLQQVFWQFTRGASSGQLGAGGIQPLDGDGGDGSDGGGDGSGDGIGDIGGIGPADVAAAVTCAIAGLTSVADCIGAVTSSDGMMTVTVIGLADHAPTTVSFADSVVGAMAGAASIQAGNAFAAGVALGLGIVVSLPVTSSIAVVGAVIGLVVAHGLAHFAHPNGGNGGHPGNIP